MLQIISLELFIPTCDFISKKYRPLWMLLARDIKKKRILVILLLSRFERELMNAFINDSSSFILMFHLEKC